MHAKIGYIGGGRISGIARIFREKLSALHARLKG